MEGTNRPQTGGCLGNAVYIVVTPESCDTRAQLMLGKRQRSRSPCCREDEGPFCDVFPVLNESWDATGDRDSACGCTRGAGQTNPPRSPAWGQGPITGGKPKIVSVSKARAESAPLISQVRSLPRFKKDK